MFGTPTLHVLTVCTLMYIWRFFHEIKAKPNTTHTKLLILPIRHDINIALKESLIFRPFKRNYISHFRQIARWILFFGNKVGVGPD